ncbi:MAG: threonine ammonia-lyase [Alphaproteobacteria bacterium]
MAVSLDDIRTAHGLMVGAVERTPCAHSRTLSLIAGCEVYLKLENEQYTASFKDRGALVKLLSLTPAERARGVIAASAGNHAQGVAYHAERLGIPATIVMPKGTPFTKVIHTRAFGAEVVLVGEDLSQARVTAEALCAKRNSVFVHPYDDERIIAGQGTVALEMLEERPELDCLIVPIGGGGLISGMALAAKALKPAIEIYGVQTELYPSMVGALRGGPAPTGGQTIAEGIAVKEPGRLTMEIIGRLATDIFLVGESAIEEAVLMLLEIEKTVAEGAGAAPLAALLANKAHFTGRRVGLVVSGGNIDTRILASILMRGLVRQGRLVRLRVKISDKPGTLAQVAEIVGELGGNIVEIYHQRLFYDVPVKLAELDVVAETRDMTHAHEIQARLSQAGFQTRILGGTAVEDGT